MTYADFIETINTAAGVALTTAKRKVAFRAHTAENIAFFTPASTNKPRRVSPKYVHEYLRVFNETQSLEPVNYPKNLFDKAYALAIIQRWLRQQQGLPN